MAERLPSPYTPGSMATFTPGRERQIALYEGVLADTVELRKLQGQVHVVHGARGVGKTSLLRAVERKARALGLSTVFVTATGNDGLNLIADGLNEQMLHLAPASITDRFRNAVSTLGVKLGPLEATADLAAIQAGRSNAIASLQEVVCAAARCTEQANRGLAIFVDEMQDVPLPDIRVLATVWQHLQAEVEKPGQEPIPAVMFAAGLSNTPDIITQGASFGERFDFTRIGNLDHGAALKAVTEPAAALGVHWSPEAIRRVLGVASGYPYFLQVYADAVWRMCRREPGDQIDADQAAEGIRYSTEKIETFYRGRWNRATPAEQRILEAIARSGAEEMKRSEIAKVLNVKTTDLSMARASLLNKGILAVPRRGVLAFNAPGFGRFILDEIEG